MRRIADILLFALVAPSLVALAAPDPGSCCPMGGDMSCCPNASAPDGGCDLRRCAPDNESGFVPQVPRAILASTAIVVPILAWQPLSVTRSAGPDSFSPDPLLPPPRA
jgi:hypothetical protein